MHIHRFALGRSPLLQLRDPLPVQALNPILLRRADRRDRSSNTHQTPPDGSASKPGPPKVYL
eukprot:4473110-Lingulodinium_polyedra.AAC.1